MLLIKPFDTATQNYLKTRNNKLPATSNSIKRSRKWQPSIVINNKKYNKKWGWRKQTKNQQKNQLFGQKITPKFKTITQQKQKLDITTQQSTSTLKLNKYNQMKHLNNYW